MKQLKKTGKLEEMVKTIKVRPPLAVSPVAAAAGHSLGYPPSRGSANPSAEQAFRGALSVPPSFRFFLYYISHNEL